MRKHSWIPVFCCIAVFLGLAAAATAGTFRGEVLQVFGGDAMEVSCGGATMKVFLWRAACPLEGQEFCDDATSLTRSLVLGKTVKIESRENLSGPMQADVYLPDNRRLDAALVKAGLAWWDKEKDPEDETLEDAQWIAKSQKAGVWSKPNLPTAWEFAALHPTPTPTDTSTAPQCEVLTQNPAYVPTPTPTLALLSQKEFHQRRKQFASQHEIEGNAIKQLEVLRSAADYTRRFFERGGFTVNDWRGVLRKLEAPQDGGCCSIVIEAREADLPVRFTTDVFGSPSQTMIRPGSAIYDKLAQMAVGTAVEFSGEVFVDGHTEITEYGSLDDPEFIMRFTNIDAVPFPKLSQKEFHEKRKQFASQCKIEGSPFGKSAVIRSSADYTRRFFEQGGFMVKDWRGVLSELKTSEDGSFCSITIEAREAQFRIHYATEMLWLPGQTMIRPGSAVYDQLAKMAVGTGVLFSGEVFVDSDTRITEQGSLGAPRFIMRFTNIKKVP